MENCCNIHTKQEGILIFNPLSGDASDCNMLGLHVLKTQFWLSLNMQFDSCHILPVPYYSSY